MLKLVKHNIINNSFSAKYLNVRFKTTRKSTMESAIVREWKSNPIYQNYKRKFEETEITVMSYNILAQDLIDKHSYLYNAHDHQDLNYDIRSKRLFNEMKRIKPDILCLQEMQNSHLMDLKLKCYTIDLKEVIFKKRTQEDLTDGCAIFFNSNKMELVHEQRVEYFQPNIYVLNRPNVAIIAKFRLKNNPTSEIVVATTHLLYNPRRQDVRLAQIQLLLTEIDRIAFQGINDNQQVQYVPVILTGDFNFKPNSAPYALILNGSLAYSALTKRLKTQYQIYDQPFGKILLPMELGVTDDCKHFNRSQSMLHNSEQQLVKSHALLTFDELNNSDLPFQTGLLSHQLNFSTVYNDAISTSTFQNRWVLVDYIFYREEKTLTNERIEKKLKLVARFELPTLQECICKLPFGGIPNTWEGSDHFSLAAKFLLSP